MRYLGIARLRLLMTTRTWSPIFVLAVLPPAIAAIAVAAVEEFFLHDAEFQLPMNAAAASLSWTLHAIFLAAATAFSGSVTRSREGAATVHVPDLLDTVPIGQGPRFWGDALGTFAATGVIHVCCLPLLAVVAAVSPLPLGLFLGLETGVLALLILASAGAAWQRSTAATKSGAARMAIGFFEVVLFLVILWMTTNMRAFRDAMLNFLMSRPSPAGWSDVVAAVEQPAAFVALVALLYAGTMLYYHFSSTSRRAWEN